MSNIATVNVIIIEPEINRVLILECNRTFFTKYLKTLLTLKPLC